MPHLLTIFHWKWGLSPKELGSAKNTYLMEGNSGSSINNRNLGTEHTPKLIQNLKNLLFDCTKDHKSFLKNPLLHPLLNQLSTCT